MSIDSVREQFPIYSRATLAASGCSQPLAYLDSAATAQKPLAVIERVAEFSRSENANIQRGAYQLSAHASELFESARQKVADLLGASSAREIVFTRGATESFNLLANSLCETLSQGDTILISLLEHHSNFVPWQLAAKRYGLNLLFAPITKEAEIDVASLLSLIEQHKPKVVSLSHLSNAFGSLLEDQQLHAIVTAVHRNGGLVAIDCAQSIVHQRIDVARLGVDFLAFSGHKLYGPTGIGVLWGRSALLEKLPPYQGGGGMIGLVSVEGTTWAEVPQRFEAGTPAIAQAIGLGAAIDFVQDLGFEQIEKHEQELFEYAWQRLSMIEGVTLYGPRLISRPQRSIIAFSVKGTHPHDLATILDQQNVQIRAGHHCAMPALTALELPATARISLGVYSQQSDIDQMIGGIVAAQRIFS